MYMFVIISCFHVLKNYVNTDDKFGIDDRVENTNVTMDRIFDIIEKRERLDMLESNKISIFDKLNSITDMTPKIYNIFNGGLLHDWNDNSI